MSFEDIAIPEGSTSLLVGAQSGNLALVRHALATEGRADPAEYVNRGNIVGETPLHVASMNHDPDEDAPITADVKRRNQVEITRLLLDAGASTETRTDLAGETPLLRAVMRAGATLPQDVPRFPTPIWKESGSSVASRPTKRRTESRSSRCWRRSYRGSRSTRCRTSSRSGPTWATTRLA